MTNLKLTVARTRAARVLRPDFEQPSTLTTPIQLTVKPRRARKRIEFPQLVGWLAAVGGLVGLISVVGHESTQPSAEPLQTLSLSEFGLQVRLPSRWKLEPGQRAPAFIANDAQSGAVLVGAVNSEPGGASLDAAMDRIIEQQRARLGPAEQLARGVAAVGPLEARWLRTSFFEQGELVRIKTFAVQRGTRILTLTCSGGPAAQKACDAAIQTLSMAR